MRWILGHAMVAAALAVAGGVCWSLGEAERQVAASHAQLATLRYAKAADSATAAASLESVRRLPAVSSSIAKDARDVRATADYWLRRYAALKPARDAAGAPADGNPRTLLLAANAAYRLARQSTADKTTTVKQLDEVINSYGEVLKSSSSREDVVPDAAYNFEFVVRMRDQVVRQRGAAGLPKLDLHEPVLTIHGRPGAPPKGVGMSEFKVVIPKRSDERQESPDGSRGPLKQRKG